MIKSSPLTVNFARINATREDYQNIVDQISSLEFTEERSYGFTIENTDQDIISAHLILTSPTKVTDYNPERNKVTERTIQKKKIIPFRINLESGFLEVFSNKKDLSELKTRLGDISSWDISIEDVEFDLDAIRSSLQDEEMKSVDSLRISDFSINEHTKGNVYLNIYDEKEAKRLISENKGNVSYMGIKLEIGQEEITLGVYSSGSLRIFNNTQKDGKILQVFEDIL
jgi:hypothetical protein